MSEAGPSLRDRARFAKLAHLAADIATTVGDAIAVEDTAIVTRKRGRANFATAADHAAERTILERLAAHDAGVPVLTEESPRKDLGRAERLWVVDPIDGTLNFSRGLPFYCVLIGYVEEGRVRAAAVHAPRTGETFLASEGAGATRNRMRIKVSSVVKPNEAFAVASLRFAETAKPGSRFAILNATCARLRVIGSAGLEIAYVAMGRLDRSEEHTSELQSRENLVCRLLLEKKKHTNKTLSVEQSSLFPPSTKHTNIFLRKPSSNTTKPSTHSAYQHFARSHLTSLVFALL